MPLTYQIEPQTQDKWCWAAVGASMMGYFVPNSPLNKQCEVAKLYFKNRGVPAATTGQACNPEIPAELDNTALLQDVLTDLKLSPQIADPLNIDDLQTQIIDNCAPVGVLISWNGQLENGHFVVITGCPITVSGEQWVDIADPYYGYSTVSYDYFRHTYLSAGSWFSSFLVQKPPQP